MIRDYFSMLVHEIEIEEAAEAARAAAITASGQIARDQRHLHCEYCVSAHGEWPIHWRHVRKQQYERLSHPYLRGLIG